MLRGDSERSDPVENPPPRSRAATISRFGPFAFRDLPPRLSRQGEPIDLRPQCAALLTLLLERSGEAVTRQEIASRLWSDEVHLDRETAINTAVSTLRRALGDDSTRPSYIETLPRKGYRFIAPIQEAPIDPDRDRSLAGRLAGWIRGLFCERSTGSLRTGLPLGAAATLALLLVPAGPASEPHATSLRLQVVPVAGCAETSAAELPPDLTDRLVGALSQRSKRHLVMTAPASGEGGTAEVLASDYFLTGRVEKDATACHLSLVLVEAKTLQPAWLGTYRCEQSTSFDWARSVGTTIAERLLPEATSIVATSSP